MNASSTIDIAEVAAVAAAGAPVGAPGGGQARTVLGGRAGLPALAGAYLGYPLSPNRPDPHTDTPAGPLPTPRGCSRVPACAGDDER